MGLLGLFRSKKPDNRDESSGRAQVGVIFATVAEARVKRDELKMQRKELAIAKKGIADEMKQLRASHTEHTRKGAMAGKGVLATIAGKEFANAQKKAQSLSNARSREALAKGLKPLERKQAEIDKAINQLDLAVLQIEKWIVSQG